MIIDMNVHGDDGEGLGGANGTCAGCGESIKDKYLLRVSPDLEWHSTCLRCCCCDQPLDEFCTCFVKDGKPYCKTDYNMLFGVKCSGCLKSFNKNDLVMRAKHHLFHVQCFCCGVCTRSLVPGDEFALRGDLVLCRADFDHGDPQGASLGPDLASDHNSSCSNDDFVVITKDNDNDLGRTTEKSVLTDCKNSAHINSPNPTSGGQSRHSCPSQRRTEGSRGSSSSSNSSNKSKTEHKTTRVRTVLNEKQLHTLRTCYGANPRPDALMKDQLVEMTGLSSRVIRVWFQNKRCKDKKRSMMIKQLQQQHQDKVHGVPMIASSPVQLSDSSSIPIQSVPVDVHSYLQHQQQQLQLHQSWTAGLDYCNASPYHSSLPSDPPPFQQLLNSFGHSSDSDKTLDEDNDDTVVSLEDTASYQRTSDGRGFLKHDSGYNTVLRGLI